MTGEKASPGSRGGVHNANGHNKNGLGGPGGSDITSETHYPLQDRTGKVVAIHVRKDGPGGKEVRWKRTSGEWGLNGTKLADLPLYGSEKLAEWPEDRPVAVVEGEPAADALNESGIILALGTVTGAGATPGTEALKVLRGREVILWPDGDEPGHNHMRRVAERLQSVAASVAVYDWPDAPDDVKGPDAANHPAVIGGSEKVLGRLLNDLLGAPEWRPPEPEKPEGLPGRVLLGELLRGGIEPTPQLLDGLLYEGRIHSIASGPGTGKTLLAEWMAIQIMKQDRSILYIDAENGPKLIAERLQELGADIKGLDELFHYYPAEVALDRESLARLMTTVGEIGPALVVFDSFADLLSIAGLEENSNDDCTRWMRTVAQPIKDAGSAVLVLDHVPKGGKGPRGGGSKRAKVDVQWNLEVTQPFDRERTGEIELKHDKDRECWLPRIVRFSVGGGVFTRSAGTIEDEDGATGLTDLQQEVYEYIKKRDAEGANWGDILSSTSGSKGSLSTTLKKLVGLNLVEKDNGRYYVNRFEPEKPVVTPYSQGSVRFSRGSVELTEPGDKAGVQYGSPPLRGEPTEPDAEPAREGDDFDRHALEALRHGNGPRKALSSHKANGTPFEQVVRSVMHYLGHHHDSVDDWEPSVMRAADALVREGAVPGDPGDEERI